MKKVMFVVLVLVFAVSAFAQTSNKVGFVKVTATSSGVAGTASSTPFGLPFQTWQVVSNVPQYGTDSWNPADVFGMQITPGSVGGADKIINQNNLKEGRITTGGFWTGSLRTDLAAGPGHAYWVQNKTVNPYSLVLAGQVNNGNYTPYGGDIIMTTPPLTVPPSASSKPISWREARIVDVWNINLRGDGFTGGAVSATDKLIEQGSLYEARCTTGAVDGSVTGWSGVLATGATVDRGIKPGKAYWLQNKHQVQWTYHYDGGPALMTAGDSGVSLPAPVITKAPSAPAKVDMNSSVKTSSIKTGTKTVKSGSDAKK